MPTHQSSPAQLARIVQSYFDALSDADFSRVPWAEDLILKTPLQPDAPLRGRAAVEAFFRPMAGQLGPIHLRRTFVNDTLDIIVAEANVGPLHVLDKFVIQAGQIVEQQNFFDPRPALDAPAPGGLTADERSLLLSMLETSRDHIRNVLGGASDSAWHRKPAAGGWSAADCAEHLILTEEALLNLVREKILAGQATPALVEELKGKDGVIVQAMRDRSAKGKTFDFLEPQNRWQGRQAALDAFLARRADTLDFVRGTRDPLHHHAAPLGELGLLDAYQWLILIAAHSDRHLAQIQDALS